MTTTTISLADLSGATADYLRSEVEVRITDVTRNLGRGDDGTFTVRLVNADRPGASDSPTSPSTCRSTHRRSSC